MERRQMLAGLAASALAGSSGLAANSTATFLEVKTWKFHTTDEQQPSRVSDFLQTGLGPALSRAGAKLAGAFAGEVGPDSPYFATITQYASLAGFEESLDKLVADEAYQHEVQKLSSGPGLPFVRLESSLLRSFDILPQPVLSDGAASAGPGRIFELRTYESPSLAALPRKVAMFNGGEIAIFQRVGLRPVFGGATLVGPKQPNLMYMLSFDNYDQREKLWRAFAGDPEWKKLSSPPQLKDSQIVANISNVILRPLPFSLIR